MEGEFRIWGGDPRTRQGKRWFGFDEAKTEDRWGVDKTVIRKYEDGPQEGANGLDGSGVGACLRAIGGGVSEE